MQGWLSVNPKALPCPLGYPFSMVSTSVSSARTSCLSLCFRRNVTALPLNQRKPDLTMLFLSAFWIVYPVMAAFPSSFGGVHDRATFSPQTSSIFTVWGGPGRSIRWNHAVTGRWPSFPTNQYLVYRGIFTSPPPPCISTHISFTVLNFREVAWTPAKHIWNLFTFILMEIKGFWKKSLNEASNLINQPLQGQATGADAQAALPIRNVDWRWTWNLEPTWAEQLQLPVRGTEPTACRWVPLVHKRHLEQVWRKFDFNHTASSPSRIYLHLPSVSILCN